MKITFSVNGGPSGDWWNWNPEEVGLGGSEEALIYLVRELRALGHCVTIDSQPCHALNGLSGLTHYPYPDIIVVWRNWRLASEWHSIAREFALDPGLPSNSGVRMPKIYLWSHDIPVDPHWSPEAAQYVDRVVVHNAHHACLYATAGCPESKFFLCSSGVDCAQFAQGPVGAPIFSYNYQDVLAGKRPIERVPGKCIYFMHPHRGLGRLRNLWPRIREAVPDATLHAFWWEPQFFLPPHEAIGIMPMRSLGHLELAREILSSDLFLYPNTFEPETMSLSCAKAQCGGAWPVTINKGGMSDTLLPYGVVCDDSDGQFVERTIDALIGGAALRKNVERDTMMSAALLVYDWKRIAKLWVQEFESQMENDNPDDAGLAGIEDGVRG